MYISKKKYSQKEILEKVGDISQLVGLKKYELKEGMANGTCAIDFKTDRLTFTVLPGRGMDIAWFSYKDIPIAYISKSGVVSANLNSTYHNEWLKGFFGGMLTTCGMSNVGPPETTDGVHYGMHGRVSYINAAQFEFSNILGSGRIGF